MGMITKNAQQCCSGTRQILKVEVSNYYIKQKNALVRIFTVTSIFWSYLLDY